VTVALRVSGLTKRYAGDVLALDEVSLDVEAGEFVTLLGPSGSGKTTLLMVIAGFERATAGHVLLRGDDITNTPPERRNLGVVFQSYALFQHMSVEANVGYPLAARKVKGKERKDRVAAALDLVGLAGLGRRRPSALSGGQQQRVALARALVFEPSILLLDEPLGALDRALRERMQAELRRLHRKLGSTFVCVTHDQDEALSMSDRVVVMSDGRIEQVGTPTDVYDRPATEFVATFVGSANLFEGTVVGHDGGCLAVDLGPLGVIRSPGPPDLADGARVKVVVRPERTRLAPTGGTGAPGPVVEGSLADWSFAGHRWQYEAESADHGRVAIASSSPLSLTGGDTVRLTWDPADTWVVEARP
jgi:putative spermidine/putrescine transport system ATP-binding protein